MSHYSDPCGRNVVVDLQPSPQHVKSGLREWATSTHLLPVEVTSVLALGIWLTNGASLMWVAMLVGFGACVTCVLLRLQPLGAIETDGGLYHVGMRRVNIQHVEDNSGRSVAPTRVPAIPARTSNTRVEVVAMYPTYMPPMEYQSWIPQRDRRWIGVLSTALGIRKFFLRDIPLVRIKVTQNAEVLNLRSPVVTQEMRVASLGGVEVSSPVSTLQVKPRTIIIFSPSFLMHAHAYAGLCLQLAARGAIVLVVQHDGEKIEELFREQSQSKFATVASSASSSTSLPHARNNAHRCTHEYANAEEDAQHYGNGNQVEVNASGTDDDNASRDSKKRRGNPLKRRLRTTLTQLRSLGRKKPVFSTAAPELPANGALLETPEEELQRLERRVDEIIRIVSAVASGDILRRLFISQSDIDSYVANKPCIHLMGHGLGGTSVLRAAQRIQEGHGGASHTLPHIGSVVSFDAWPRPLETLQLRSSTENDGSTQHTSLKVNTSSPSATPSSSSSSTTSSASFSPAETSPPTTFLLLDSEEWVEHHGTTRVLKHIHCDGFSQYAERPILTLRGTLFHDRYTGTNHWSISDIGRLCSTGIPSAAIKILGIHPKMIRRTTKKGKVQRRALLDIVAQRVIEMANSK